MNKTGLILSFRRHLGRKSNLPSYFSDPTVIPQEYDLLGSQVKNPSYESTTDTHRSSGSSSSVAQNQNMHSHGSSSSGDKHEGFFREITSLIAMCGLGYLAIDNYASRIKLEKLNNETTAINLKTLQIQQANFANALKKRDLQIIQERRDGARRNFKMGLHIALLRKQLIDAGITPVDIDKAIAEFETNVKADNSINNVSGQALWLDDSSRKYHENIT